MAWSTGLQALQGAVQEGREKAAAREAGDTEYRRVPGYYNWKAGDKKIIRFLTDDILTEDFYTQIVCSDGRPRTFLVNPDNPDILEKYISPTPGIGWKKEFGTGELMEPWCSKQTVGIAVQREEVLMDGKLIVQDKKEVREYKDKKFEGLFFGIVQQAISNFWEPLTTGIYERFGSISDRDIEVVRTGNNKSTNYGFMPLNQLPDLATTAAVQLRYFYGYQDNPEDPDRLMKCPMTMSEWAEYYSSDEYYARFLLPKGSQSTPAGGTSQPSRDEAQTQVSSSGSGTFASLRDNLVKGQDGPPF